MTIRGARILPVVVAVAAVVTLALSSIAITPASASDNDLPPSKFGDLAKLFRADVKPLGLRVSRGLLQNPDTYAPDPHGTHLALYVEPTSSRYNTADYLENFTKLTHKFVPMVFDRWKGLQTFDICQEPVDDSREAPPPVTQIYVSRDALDRVGDWKTATLAELLAAAPQDRRRTSDYYLYFNPAVRAEPQYEQAANEAGTSTSGATTTTSKY